jgi:hypothetical protein
MEMRKVMGNMRSVKTIRKKMGKQETLSNPSLRKNLYMTLRSSAKA